MSEIFQWVYELLKWISESTGLTYREVNIVVYFIVIPSLVIYLVSRIFKKPYLILGFLGFIIASLVLIPDFETFSNWLFDKSVDFLNLFKVLGLNYTDASVLICVFIPIIFIVALMLFKKKHSKAS